MRIQVTLVNPPYPIGSHLHPPFLPLGLGYLAAVLEKNDYAVDVIDCQALKLSLEQFRGEIGKRQPTVIGITSTTLTYKSALQIAQIAKQVHPNCMTIIGGPHVTFWDDKALQEAPQLDIIVRKEGEITFLELIKRMEADRSYSDVLGITYRKDGERILRNDDRPYIENLDELPFPALHLWPIDQLRKYGEVIFPLTTTRGCVFWCNFCTAVRMFGRNYRMRSTKNVADELEHLNKKFGADHFTFYDDAFTVNQARTEELCQEIINRKLKIRWNCETRVDMVTKELLAKMKQAGCTDVWFGVESGSQRVINEMDKGIMIEQTEKAFKWAKEVGLMTVANVILGIPTETRETAWETVKFIEKLNPNDVGYYIATPYPGTPMYEEVVKNGWLKVTDFNRYDTATPTFETPDLTMERLREIKYKAHQKFYLRPSYVFKMMRKGGTYGRSGLKTSAAYALRAMHIKLS